MTAETLTIQSAVSIDLEWIRQRAGEFGQTAEGLAKLTLFTEVDDIAARFLGALSRSPELWDWFAKDVLRQHADGIAFSHDASDPMLIRAAAEAGTTPEKFVEYIPAILAIFEIVAQILKRRRGG